MVAVAVLCGIISSSIFTMCTSDRSMEKILSTVPGSSYFVMVAHADNLIRDAGLQNGKIPADLASLFNPKSPQVNMLKGVLEGKAGVSPRAMALFADGQDKVLTFFVDDEKKFMNYFSSYAGGWSKQNSVNLSSKGNMAVCDGQCWIFSAAPSAEKVKGYLALGKKHSFVGCEYSDRLVESDEDVAFFGDINTIFNALDLPFDKIAQMRMALSMSAKDLKYVLGEVEFESGKAEASCYLVDKNLKSATLTLDFGTLKKSDIMQFPGNADLLFGIALKPESARAIASQMKSPVFPANYASLIGGIDGNILIGMESAKFSPSSGKKGLGIVMEFEDSESASLVETIFASTISDDVKVSNVNNVVSAFSPFSSPTLKPQMVSALDGAYAGVVFEPSALADYLNDPSMALWQTISVALLRHDGTLCLQIKGVTADKSANSLYTILRTIARSGNSSFHL